LNLMSGIIAFYFVAALGPAQSRAWDEAGYEQPTRAQQLFQPPREIPDGHLRYWQFF
jgi:hypothetical protein